jgi:hypothetical protein
VNSWEAYSQRNSWSGWFRFSKSGHGVPVPSISFTYFLSMGFKTANITSPVEVFARQSNAFAAFVCDKPPDAIVIQLLSGIIFMDKLH